MLTLAPQVFVARFAAGSKVRTAAWIVGFALLTGLLAQFEIHAPGLTPVPFTGQTLAVLLAGAALGAKAGAASMGVYNLLGMMGLPVYSGGESGLEVAIGATSGYLIGFIAAAYVVGRLAERRADRHARTAIPAFVAGSATIYGFGVVGLMTVLDMSLTEAFTAGVVPFVVGDALKAGAAGLLTPTAWRLRSGD